MKLREIEKKRTIWRRNRRERERETKIVSLKYKQNYFCYDLIYSNIYLTSHLILILACLPERFITPSMSDECFHINLYIILLSLHSYFWLVVNLRKNYNFIQKCHNIQVGFTIFFSGFLSFFNSFSLILVWMFSLTVWI